MSKAEVEKFATLMNAWHAGYPGAQDDLLEFLATYHNPLINALRFYAADKA